MLVRRKLLKLGPAVAAASLIETFTRGALAQSAAQGNSSQPGSMPAYTPDSPKVAAGSVDVAQLVLLMDTDKNGKISKAEWMNFMSKEFDRLDTDHSGELDVHEIAQSRLRATRHSNTGK